MNDLFRDIAYFFSVSKELYGDTLLLDHEIIDPDQHVSGFETECDHKQEKMNESGKLTSYYHQIKNCKKCSLAVTRTNFVFGMGNSEAEIVFVGEAPGREEDLQGVPFIGKAGQLLSQMLISINIKREDVYITNVLKCRPPNNRDPLPDEIESCEPYLLQQINLLNPKLIVALGRFAAASLLRKNAPLGDLRKTEHRYNNVPLIVTFHPSALLRNPLWKKQAWEDLKMIRKYV
jgi:DNA polymerase